MTMSRKTITVKPWKLTIVLVVFLCCLHWTRNILR